MAGAGGKLNHLSIPESCLPQLLSSLEILCRDEDIGVREKAVKALSKIGIGLNEKVMAERFVPVIQRLVDGRRPTGRASACTLLNAPYPTLSMSLKSRMNSAYSKLCRDSESLVRQEAATNLWKFAATVDSVHLEHEVMILVQDFMKDGDEFVRSSAIESCGALQNLLETPVFMAYILPVFAKGVKDPSLRVRHMVANQLQFLCDDSSGGILHTASSAGILHTASSAGILPWMKEATKAIPVQGILGLIGVCAALCGVYFGFNGLKEGVTGLKELVGVLAGEIKTAREVWIAKGCPALITVYPDVFLRSNK